MVDTLITGGTVVTPEGAKRLDVVLNEGRIEGLLEPGTQTQARDVIDATGKHVLPGAIDIHFHVRAPAYPQRGTVASETRAAAAGGVTTLFETAGRVDSGDWQLFDETTHPQPDAFKCFSPCYPRALQNLGERTRPRRDSCELSFTRTHRNRAD